MYGYFARWAARGAAQTRLKDCLAYRARGDRPPVSLGECASETNGRGYRLGNEWSRPSTSAERHNSSTGAER